MVTSNNKARATWKVIRNATGNDHVSTNITCLKNMQKYSELPRHCEFI
jgi:hypothetical protein